MSRCDCPNDIQEEQIRQILPRIPARDRALIEIGLQTGLRLSELLSLTVSQMWRDGRPVGVLHVARRNLKGGRALGNSVRSRAIPLNLRAREAIAAYLGGPEIRSPASPLFPSRNGRGAKALTRQAARNCIHRHLVDAGLSRDYVWGAHSLRKRFARKIYEATKDIQVTRAALGHRFIVTTQAYLGEQEEEAGCAILRMGEPANGEDARQLPKEVAG